MLCPLCHTSYDAPTNDFCEADGTVLVEAPSIQKSPIRATEATGTLVQGRYLILGHIGRGGLADVYLAEDKPTGKHVALKILHGEQARVRTTRERFRREVEIAAQIGHPNIVAILDAGEVNRTPFIVLEYLDGESLGSLLSRAGRLHEDFTLLLIKRVAAALAAAHAGGVIHRDIKPDNLFLVRDGGMIKVLDFGMARLRESALTATGVVLGTVPYMAPEQAMSDRVDGRTDVYGLGITMFKMLTGRLPFDARDESRLVAHHLYTPIPAPSSFQQGLSPAVEHLIIAATRKRPENRYRSMRALLEDVGRVLGERPGKLEAPGLQTEPDLYEPENPMAKSAARHLRSLIK